MAIWCGWTGLLRPGEIWALKPDNFHLTKQAIIIGLGKCKTSTTGGAPLQSVRLLCPTIREAIPKWIQWRSQRRDQHMSISQLYSSSKKAEALWLHKQKLIGFPETFCISSIRPGAATQAHLEGLSFDVIQDLGRWECAKTLKHYVQTCENMLLHSRLEGMKNAAVIQQIAAQLAPLSKEVFEKLQADKVYAAKANTFTTT